MHGYIHPVHAVFSVTDITTNRMWCGVVHTERTDSVLFVNSRVLFSMSEMKYTGSEKTVQACHTGFFTRS